MAIFTRRHYIWLTHASRHMLAEVAKATNNDPAQIALVKFAICELADQLAIESPGGFDRQRFLANAFSTQVSPKLEDVQ